MIIPFQELQLETLDALIEEFVTREGAIQGHTDVPLETKINSVRAQLKSGKILIVFDETTETCSIIPKDSAPQ